MLQPGTMIGRRYRVEQLLGAGGLGTVYFCADTVTGDPVAVKRLKEDVPLPEIVIEQIKREAALLSQLRHRNIIRILDLGQDQQGLYYVLEFIDGPTLSHLLKYGPVPLDTFYSFAGQTLEGLSAAHRKGILHLDIKPANIMLDGHPEPGFTAKILDFGLAKITDEIANPRENELTIGSVYYISPEQLIHAPLDGRADLYSLGMVCYHLLLGEVAFPDPDPAEVREAQLHRRAPDLFSLSPELPRELCKWVHRLIEKDPADRPAHAQEALNLLMRVMTHKPTQVSQIATKTAQVGKFISESKKITGRWSSKSSRFLFWKKPQDGDTSSTDVH